MHDGQEEDLNGCLDCHRFNIDQLRKDHNSLREDYQELDVRNVIKILLFSPNFSYLL